MADQLRALRDQKIFAGRAVIDRLRHLGGDLARQIGTNARDERGGDHGAGLHDIRRGLGVEPVWTDRALVRRSVEECRLAVLHVLRGAGVDRRCGRWARRRPRRSRRGEPDRLGLLIGLGEETAEPRRLDLLGPALRLRIRRRRGRHGVRRSPCVEDRLAEIAGQRRPERGRLARQAGVVLRQASEALGGGTVLRGKQLLAALRRVASLERVAERARNGERRNGAQANQHPARQACDARPLAPKPQIGRYDGRRRRRLFFRTFRRHDRGLPSVRTMRTRRSLSLSPRRNSAAANRRSTM